MLAGGVGGQLGFGGECTLVTRMGLLGWSPFKGRLSPRCLPPHSSLCLVPTGKPPKTYGGALGALGFRGECCLASPHPSSEHLFGVGG